MKLLLDPRIILWAATRDLPAIHKDPFDRLLVAQAQCEGLMLVTADPLVATYPGPIRRI